MPRDLTLSSVLGGVSGMMIALIGAFDATGYAFELSAGIALWMYGDLIVRLRRPARGDLVEELPLLART